MNIFRRFALVFCALVLSTACTRKTEDKTAVSMSLPMTGSVLGKPGVAQSLSSQNTLLGSLDKIVLNVSGGPDGLIVCSIDVDRNRVEGPCSFSVSGTTASLSLDIKPGSSQLLQAVLAYQSETSSALYYGSSRTSISGSNANVNLPVSSLGVGVVSMGIQGRYLRYGSDPGLSGTVEMKFRPNASDPPVTIKRSTMVAGWFSTMVLGEFDNLIEVQGTTLFNGPVRVSSFLAGGSQGFFDATTAGSPPGRFVADGGDHYQVLGFFGPGRATESVPMATTGCGGGEYDTCLQLRNTAPSFQQSNFLGPFQRIPPNESLLTYSSGTLTWTALPQITSSLVSHWNVYQYSNLTTSKVSQLALGDREWDCTALQGLSTVAGSGVTLLASNTFVTNSYVVGAVSPNTAWFVCPMQPGGALLNTALVYPKSWDISDSQQAPYFRLEKSMGMMPTKFARNLCYDFQIRSYQSGSTFMLEFPVDLEYDQTKLRIYSNSSDCQTDTGLLSQVSFAAATFTQSISIKYIDAAAETNPGFALALGSAAMFDISALNSPVRLFAAEIRPRMPSAWLPDTCYSILFEVLDDEGRLAIIDQPIHLNVTATNNVLSAPFSSANDCASSTASVNPLVVGSSTGTTPSFSFLTRSAPFVAAPSLNVALVGPSAGLTGVNLVGSPSATLAAGTRVVDRLQVLMPAVVAQGDCAMARVRFLNAQGVVVPYVGQTGVTTARIRLSGDGPANAQFFPSENCSGTPISDLDVAQGVTEVPVYFAAGNLGLTTLRAQITGHQAGLQAQASTTFFAPSNRPYLAANITRFSSGVRVIGTHEFPLTAQINFGNATGINCSVTMIPCGSEFSMATMVLSYSNADWGMNRQYEFRVWNKATGQSATLKVSRDSFLSARPIGMTMPDLMTCAAPAGMPAGTYNATNFAAASHYCLQPGANIVLSGSEVVAIPDGASLVGHTSGVNTITLNGTSQVSLNAISSGTSAIANFTINSNSTNSTNAPLQMIGNTGTGNVFLSNVVINSSAAATRVVRISGLRGTKQEVNDLTININAAGTTSALHLGNVSDLKIAGLRINNSIGNAMGLHYDSAGITVTGTQTNNKIDDFFYQGNSHGFYSQGSGGANLNQVEGSRWELQTTSGTLAAIQFSGEANLTVKNSQVRQIGTASAVTLTPTAGTSSLNFEENVVLHENSGSSSAMTLDRSTAATGNFYFGGNHFVRKGASAAAGSWTNIIGSAGTHSFIYSVSYPMGAPATNTNLLCSDSANRYTNLYAGGTAPAGDLNTLAISLTDPNMVGASAVSAVGRCTQPNP